jgi:indole-3-glycerol phosphate synthase
VILDDILAHKRVEVSRRRTVRPLEALLAESKIPVEELPAGRSNPSLREKNSILSRAKDQPFSAALRQPGVSFIAEIKRMSPSGGELRPGASAGDLARMYAASGAAALSVLTDERYFGGSDADLIEAHAASGLPALRKDFVVDAYQIYEARAMGADAVLLIVRALADTELSSLLQLTHALGMDALVETHSAHEVDRALRAGARIIGVNNRDLDTLITDVTLAPRLRPMVPPHVLFVAESGISMPEQIEGLLDAGVDAVLIGESLLRAADPGEKLRSLVAAGLVHA